MRLRSWPLLVTTLIVGCGAPDGPLGTAEEPIKVCAGKTTLEGIDVSHYDGTVDWAQVKASGRAFAFVKATEGTTYKDPKFDANWAAMKQHGIVRSAYHFFHANMDPIAEADHFLQVMGSLEVGDLPPTLDLEVADGQTGAVITTNTIKWLDHVAAATGVTPILYTSPSFVTSTLGSPAGLDAKAQLWIANWQVTCPDVPAPFATWPFWQYDDMGTVPGISGSGNVDLDVFNGGAAELQALTLQAPSSSSASSSSSSSTSSGGTGGAGGGSASSSGAGGGSSGSGGLSTSGSGSGGAAGTPGAVSGCATAPGSAERGAAAWLSALSLLYHGGRRRRRAAPAA
jgi:lysozyme